MRERRGEGEERRGRRECEREESVRERRGRGVKMEWREVEREYMREKKGEERKD